MPATTAPEQPPAVDQPKHPIHTLTTFELRGYRGQLENAIAFFDARQPPAPVRADLHARLDEVQAEEQSRARIAANA
jgi:hypothetical protein